MEAASNELSPLLLKTSERCTGDRYTDVIKICDKHFDEQSKIVQNIMIICSELTGWKGCENHCNKIINLCKQLLSETHNSSNLIIALCYGITNSNVVPSKVGKKTETQSESIPKSTEIPPSISPAACIKVESDDIENDIAEDTVYNTENLVNVNDINNDSGSEVDVRQTEYESESISVKNDINSTACGQNGMKSLKTSDFVSFDDLNIEGLNDELEDTKCQPDSDSDSDWEPEPKTTKKPVEKRAIATSNSKKVKKIKKIAVDDEVEFACKLCHCNCKSAESIKKHYETIHTPNYTDRNKIACDICKLNISSKKGLSSHKAHVHSTVRPHKCDICSYSAKSLNRLKRHKLIHSSFRKYQCEICGASFKLNSVLLRHKNTVHVEVYNYSCQFCPKEFKAKDKLLKHEKIHLEIYDYQCKICGKKIRKSWNLKAHMRTHTGDKPYTCERCGQSFAHNVTRKKHMITCFVPKPEAQT